MNNYTFTLTVILVINSLAQNSFASNHEVSIDIENYDQIKGKAGIQFTPNTHEKYIGGAGEVEYSFDIQRSGWYSLLLHSASWPVDIFIDNDFVTHTTLVDLRNTSNTIVKHKYKRILNVYLSDSVHKLRFKSDWAPGLPLIRGIVLQSANTIENKFSMVLAKNRAVYSQYEDAPVEFLVSKQAQPFEVFITVNNDITKKLIHTSVVNIMAGNGNENRFFMLPSSDQGVYSVDIKTKDGVNFAKSFQYVVVDDVPSKLQDEEKVFVSSINALVTPPDYSSTETFINDGSIDAYRESKGNGYYNGKKTADFFSYLLKIPEKDQLYMVEIEIPNDKKRSFSVSVVDTQTNPYAIDAGVMTGREHPLSSEMQSIQLYFYGKDKRQSLLFLNWHSGEKIAVKSIKLYLINALSNTIKAPKTRRRTNAMYYEEPMRFTTYFGSDTKVKDWANIYKAAIRWALWSRANHINHWVLTVAAYQGRMWPTDLLPGLAPGDVWPGGMHGKLSNKDILEKDILRLLLLIAEKYDIKVSFELQLKPNKVMASYFASQWMHKEKNYDDYMIFSKNGLHGKLGPGYPFFNPVNNNVQNWILSIFTELASRYQSLPAFDGISIRLMKWAFSGWQAFPSINWGYGDYTINKFEVETGIIVPVNKSDKDRYLKRYNWLLAHAYSDWIEWRSKSIRDFHANLENTLSSARNGLNLRLNIFDPSFASLEKKHKGKRRRLNRILDIEEYDNKGWSALLKEAGIDVSKYSSFENTDIVPVKKYPAGIRINRNSPLSDYRISAMLDLAIDKTPSIVTKKVVDEGYTNSMMFYNEYMEADINVADIGLSSSLSTRKRNGNLRICSVLNPVGRNMLARYAHALADGNVTFFADGGLGYTLGQPHITDDFMAEYMSIPAIGMNRHSDADDAVSLWYGNDEGQLYFYLVNRMSSEISVKVKFSAKISLQRLTREESYVNDSITLNLMPYELMAFKTKSVGEKVISVEPIFSETTSLTVSKEISQAHEILNSFKHTKYYRNIYQSEIDTAVLKLNEIDKLFSDGKFFNVRKGLMSHQLVRIYELYNQYPTGFYLHE